jgi:hypothetical protein
MATSGIIVMGEVLDWLDARIRRTVSNALIAQVAKNTGLKTDHYKNKDHEAGN